MFHWRRNKLSRCMWLDAWLTLLLVLFLVSVHLNNSDAMERAAVQVCTAVDPQKIIIPQIAPVRVRGILQCHLGVNPDSLLKIEIEMESSRA